MNCNLLHKTKLPAFIQWLRTSGIQYRDGRGTYQVLQVLTQKTSWQCVFDRHDATQHYTVAAPLEGIVRKFIKETKVTT